MGDAPANTTTHFDITAIGADLPFPIPGTPFFSLAGVYNTSTGGVTVAIDSTDAATLVSSGADFDSAFPSFSDPSGSPFGESLLAFGMANPYVTIVDGFSGSELIQIFADTPEQQIPQLFTPYNGSGTSSASLVNFSDATAGGTVSISVSPGISTPTPEPATGWMLGVIVLSLAGLFKTRSQPAPLP